MNIDLKIKITTNRESYYFVRKVAVNRSAIESFEKKIDIIVISFDANVVKTFVKVEIG